MLLGQRWSDPKLQETIKALHYRVQGNGDRLLIKVNVQGREHTYTPEKVAGILMGKLRDMAAESLGEDVRDAIVAVPTCYNDRQRQAIKDAGVTAQLEVIRTINESTAVIMAYELDRKDDEQNVVVLDLGASKTDVTVLNIDQGFAEVLATVSRPTIGRMLNRQLVD